MKLIHLGDSSLPMATIIITSKEDDLLISRSLWSSHFANEAMEHTVGAKPLTKEIALNLSETENGGCCVRQYISS